jgi:hypothetical protein
MLWFAWVACGCTAVLVASGLVAEGGMVGAAPGVIAVPFLTGNLFCVPRYAEANSQKEMPKIREII